MKPAATLTSSELAAARKRRLAAVRLQEIECNPLTPDEIRMFEMFEAEAWPHWKRRAHILARAKPLAAE